MPVLPHFDALVIRDSSGSEIAECASFVGPLESGFYDFLSGDWIAALGPTLVDAPGFGVDSGGNPYFDTSGPSPGESAELWVDGVSGDVWLETL